MIYIIQKIIVLLENKGSISQCFFKEYNRLLVFLKKLLFS